MGEVLLDASPCERDGESGASGIDALPLHRPGIRTFYLSLYCRSANPLAVDGDRGKLRVSPHAA